MKNEKFKLLAKEEHLLEELSNVKVQLIALGQNLMALGHYLKENPVQILLTGCDVNNPDPKCAEFSMDFKELQECPHLITKLLRSYNNLQGKLEEVRAKLEELDDEEENDD